MHASPIKKICNFFNVICDFWKKSFTVVVFLYKLKKITSVNIYSVGFYVTSVKLASFYWSFTLATSKSAQSKSVWNRKYCHLWSTTWMRISHATHCSFMDSQVEWFGPSKFRSRVSLSLHESPFRNSIFINQVLGPRHVAIHITTNSNKFNGANKTHVNHML